MVLINIKVSGSRGAWFISSVLETEARRFESDFPDQNFSRIAQLVERRSVKADVVGSYPTPRAKMRLVALVTHGK